MPKGDAPDKFPARAMTLVGVAGILFSTLGFWYNFQTIFMDFSGFHTEMEGEVNPEYFYAAFYSMSGICIIFYSALFLTSIQLIRKQANWAFGLLAIVALELVYYLVIGMMWARSPYGMSVGAATGISSGGLMFQAVALYPLWGPVVALWARSRLTIPRPLN